MKIRYEMQTSLGRARRSFSLSTTPGPRVSGLYRGALAIAVIVLVLLMANSAGILAQVIQVVTLLGSRRVLP
jgi:hypothetical protein